MDRKEFLKTLGFGAAAITALPSVLSGNPESPKTQKDQLPTEEISFKGLSDFKHGDVVRYIDKNGEWRYCVVNGHSKKILLPLEQIEPLNPTRKELSTLQHLSRLKTTDYV